MEPARRPLGQSYRCGARLIRDVVALNESRGNMAEHSEKPRGFLAGRWHLVAAECPEAADSPFLVMAAVADRFEGGWDKLGTEHIRLKLIRARK
jgi:hypothetical protein